MLIKTVDFFNNKLEIEKRRVDGMAIKPSYTCYIVSDSKGEFNKASERYVSLKHDTSSKIGIECIIKRLTPKDFAMEMIEVAQNEAPIVAMLQLPCPEVCSELFQSAVESGAIIDADHLMPDVLHDMWDGIFSRIPATPRGVMELLKSMTSLEGKKVAVVGSRSKTTGQYLIPLLQNANATVSMYHSRSRIGFREFEDYDVIISCVGKAGMIKQEHLGRTHNKICIDIGVSVVDGKVRGDFHEDIREYNYFTPWVSGIGLLTRLYLCVNVIDIFERGVGCE